MGVNKILMWALTYRCNISCKYCFLCAPDANPSRSKGELNDVEIKAILSSITDHARPNAVWITGGEPTLKEIILEVVESLETNGISTIITTNGLMPDRLVRELCKCKPRGITISLDFPDENVNDQLRAATLKVIDNIRYITRLKSEYTKLGVAVTISKDNINHLFDIAQFLKTNGSDYMSINPLFAWDRLTASELDVPKCASTQQVFKASIKNIIRREVIQLPCNMYLELLSNYIGGATPPFHVCPSGHDFAFISPWGGVYPCSCEFWHSDSRFHVPPSPLDCDWKDVFRDLASRIDGKHFNTHSNCFGARCIGCWKLFYDDVFVSTSRSLL